MAGQMKHQYRQRILSISTKNTFIDLTFSSESETVSQSGIKNEGKKVKQVDSG